MMPSFPGVREVFAKQFARLSAAVPPEVEMGIHLCYGDFEAKHFVEPLDTGKMVELANLFTQNSAHPLTWIHVPVPIARDDEAYFAPLARLVRGENTELYLGLVHATDGTDGTRRRMQAARKTVTDFGIATECGMGRSRTPEVVRELLRVQGEAARPAG
jgi:methionine synthase II (cobalamin-independent)